MQARRGASRNRTEGDLLKKEVLKKNFLGKNCCTGREKGGRSEARVRDRAQGG